MSERLKAEADNAFLASLPKDGCCVVCRYGLLGPEKFEGCGRLPPITVGMRGVFPIVTIADPTSHTCVFFVRR